MLRRTLIITLALALVSGAAFGAAQQDLDAAVAAGKAAFVVVYDAAAQSQLVQARQTAAAAALRAGNAVTIDVNRDEPANADFVKKYGLATAPMPLILVSSSTGVITGGVIAAQATPEQLVKLIPSPKQVEIFQAISSGNAVFITASRKGMASTATVNGACAAACQQMAGKSVQVTIDMDDPREATFLTSLKVNMQSAEPVTLVANAQGQIAGVYTGAIQVNDLVTAATKKVGGCCPPTTSNPNASCAPTKK